ncbi:PP0621 family protein [Ideonella sp.]|uniref:PP0621 family protein n=1 Tax=Ideonella sp. TaxID=1929293 RepID=UPI0035B4F8C3
MAKLLLLIALVVIVALWWFGKGRPRPVAERRAEPAGPQSMVACAQCGTHLPAAESVEGEGGRHYCCAEHRRLGPAR